MGVCCKCVRDGQIGENPEELGVPPRCVNNIVVSTLLKGASHEQNEQACRESPHIEGEFINYKPINQQGRDNPFDKCVNARQTKRADGCEQPFPLATNVQNGGDPDCYEGGFDECLEELMAIEDHPEGCGKFDPLNNEDKDNIPRGSCCLSEEPPAEEEEKPEPKPEPDQPGAIDEEDGNDDPLGLGVN
jgi:hypothetical protein